jgi:hypothetical protein
LPPSGVGQLPQPHVAIADGGALAVTAGRLVAARTAQGRWRIMVNDDWQPELTRISVAADGDAAIAGRSQDRWRLLARAGGRPWSTVTEAADLGISPGRIAQPDDLRLSAIGGARIVIAQTYQVAAPVTPWRVQTAEIALH